MEKSRYFLVVNLIAGQGRCKALFPQVKQELDRRGIDYDLHYTNEPLEATDVARMGIEAGFRCIVAMGGDGTVNEVTNGLVGSEATLAVIPAGTGNDFIRMVGIPSDPRKAIDVLTNGEERRIDLGYVVGNRYFINGVGIGIDAQVARDVLKMERLRGPVAYIVAAVREVFRFRTFPITVRGVDWEENLECISVGIANGKYCGGGFKLAPRAEVDDGLIDLSAIEDFPRLERLVRLPQARKGTHLGLPEVHYRQAEEVTVSSPAKLVAHIDGEPYELPEGAFRVAAVPRALRVLVPR
jgi:YegS/Rv2252/BmrU family lipid kinase